MTAVVKSAVVDNALRSCLMTRIPGLKVDLLRTDGAHTPPLVVIKPTASMTESYGTFSDPNCLRDFVREIDCIGVGRDHCYAIRDKVVDVISAYWTDIANVIGEPTFREGSLVPQSGTLWLATVTIQMKVSA